MQDWCFSCEHEVPVTWSFRQVSGALLRQACDRPLRCHEGAELHRGQDVPHRRRLLRRHGPPQVHHLLLSPSSPPLPPHSPPLPSSPPHPPHHPLLQLNLLIFFNLFIFFQQKTIEEVLLAAQKKSIFKSMNAALLYLYLRVPESFWSLSMLEKPEDRQVGSSCPLVVD